MTADHYDEELLLDLSAAGAEVLAHDEHLRACTKCRETLTSLNGIASALRSEEVWDGPDLNPNPNAQVLATLRAAQNRLQTEDAAAEEFVKHLLAGDRESWAPRLAAHPEWRTAGTVRKLIAATDRAIETMPPDALEIANVAVAIAEGLADMPLLQAQANFERGYALMYTGSYVDALASLDRADELARPVISSEHLRGRISVVRAYVQRVLEKLLDATSAASVAIETFDRYGDHQRLLAAKIAYASVLQHGGRYRDALSVHEEISSSDRSGMTWRIAALQNAALCYREIGSLDLAISRVTEAIALSTAEGMVSTALHARWTLARILAAKNRHEDAITVYRGLKSDFEAAGMANEVAIVSVDTAESLVVLGRTADVAELCRDAMQYFADAGLTETQFALSALATLREAAISGNISMTRIANVRAMLVPPKEKRDPRSVLTLGGN